MTKYHIISFFFLLCFLAGIEGYAQHNFIKYSVQDGLPQSQVFSGFQDSKGYLWFGTQGGGISRFDGETYENFNHKNGLPSNYINTISEGQNGRMWFGGRDGLFYSDGLRFIPVFTPDSSIINVNTIFYNRQDSSIWIGTEKGVYRYYHNLLKKIQLSKRLDRTGINDIIQDNKAIWIATNNGVWKISDKVKQFTKPDGLLGNSHVDLLIDHDGQLWVTTYDAGLSLYNKETNSFKSYWLPEFDKPLCIYETLDYHIWVGTRENGIYYINTQDSSITIINEEGGLPHNHVREIFRDSWNNTWVCTSGGGIAKYIGREFIHYNANNGLVGKYIYALEIDKNGDLLISASNNGLINFNGFSFEKYTADSNYINVKTKSICVDKKGNTWIGTESKGLIRVDSIGQLYIYTTNNGLPENYVKNIIEDNLGNIWFSTRNKGIVKISKLDSVNYTFKSYSREEGLPDLYISNLKMSKTGQIWFSTKLGNIGYIEENYVAKIWGKDNGVPPVNIRSIAFDNYNNLWIGTSGKGLFYSNITTDSLVFKPISKKNELHSNNIYSLVFDQDHNLWVGNESGVDKITLQNGLDVEKIEHYGKNQGFHGIETCQNASLMDKDGNLWFGTMNGLMKHNRIQSYQSLDDPRVFFKEPSLFYRAFSSTKYGSFVLKGGEFKDGLILDYNDNHLNFEFKALNINEAKGLKYRWRLLGVEDHWSPYSKKTSVDYSNLGAGYYCFEVHAISKNGKKSNKIKSCFRIKEPLWQQSWVQAILVICFILLFWGLSYRWKRKLEKRESEKRAKLELKNHVLELEQKALQLQMNPHFIFNALNSIQALVASKEHIEARSQINNFAKLMRGILSNSRQEKISLDKEISGLRTYLEIEQFCQKTKFTFSIIVNNNIDTEEVEIPPMILQPFVENAIIHGISHLNDAGKINIKFKIETYSSNTKLLICTIEDNGVGRNKSALLNQSNKPGHQSLSMDVTKDRLENLRGKLKYKSLIIEDKITDKNVLNGTIVIVKIPLEIQF